VVIPDSDVWIDYFKDRASASGRALERLIIADQSALVGIVVTELLRGAKTLERQSEIRETFRGVDYIEMDFPSWERAGYIAATLDAQGTPLPLPDVLVAAMALEQGHELFTRDKHFNRIPGLRLYQPSGGTR
jgi:predicted nucleic acid-binding protein